MRVLLILLVISLSLFTYFTIQIYKDHSSMAANIEKYVIVQSDTLQIVDYSYSYNNYTMSNGRLLDRKFIESCSLYTYKQLILDK